LYNINEFRGTKHGASETVITKYSQHSINHTLLSDVYDREHKNNKKDLAI